MTVPSWQFLVFALAGAVAFNLMPARWWRSTVWLVLNLTFVWSFARYIVEQAEGLHAKFLQHANRSRVIGPHQPENLG